MRPFNRAAVVVISTLAFCTAALAQSDAAQSAHAAPALTKKQIRQMNWKTEKDVRKALTSTKGLDASGIVVIARGSTITLDGSVPDDNQIQLAQAAVQNTGLNKSVVNKLTVKEAGH
jgi:osmotically-inducible protein OsmY